MLWLAQHHQRIIGIEISEIAVNAFFAENLLIPTVHRHQNGTKQYTFDEITILCGDLFEQQIDRIDAIYDRAALIALPPALRVQYAKRLISMLSEHGKMMLMTVSFPADELQSPPYRVTEAELAELFAGFQIRHLGREEATLEHPRRQQGVSYFHEDVWLIERAAN
ncbi:Thiopurine S-methyltransferase [Vibrio stylophorae]|uniref:Thiopurine S-methyltransferase n=2 Tax=Vibrio stylophorae TaxID=659351 RepID=A0ABM8ZSL3_9VIBR|nr:Thiopurine S-methyltransferase [Vibrio stylophorae]